MTKLYAFDLQPYRDGGWRELLPELSDDRRRRTFSCRFDPDRARMAGVGWLLQYALAQEGIPRREQRFGVTEHGKPYLLHHPELHFSLSHSGNWAVCAVGDQPLGVDVELPRCTMNVARRYFEEEELTQITTLPSLQQRDALNRLWTGKEAFVKAVGLGLSLPLNSFRISISDTGAVLIQSHSPLPYVLHEYQPDLCRICLCTVGEKPRLQIVTR